MIWQHAVERWSRRWLQVVAEHRGPGRFGEQSYWQTKYDDGRGPEDWFLSASVAARSAAAAVAGRETSRVLHVGCGVSLLGAAVVDELRSRGQEVDLVVNADCSEAALRRLAQRTLKEHRSAASVQHYACWDAASGGTLDGGPFDLVLDKGMLDALQFGGARLVVSYCQALRDALSPAGGLYLHWSDDPPEMKTDLLKAAFPHSEGWHVSWVKEADGDGAESSRPSFFEWTYYRYAVVASQIRSEGPA